MNRMLVAVAVAALLAVTVAVGTEAVVGSLPAGATLPLWPGGPRWSPAPDGHRGFALAAGFGAFAVLILLGMLIDVLWRVVAAAADYILWALERSRPNEIGPDVAAVAGMRAIVALVVLAGLVSAFAGNGLLLDALVLAALVVALVIVLHAAVRQLNANQGRFTIRSRASAIGGGQGEWEFSTPLALLVLAVALAGGIVGLTAIAVRPAAERAARTEPVPTPDKPAKPTAPPGPEKPDQPAKGAE